MTNPTSEADLIESAYEDQVRTIYNNLFACLQELGGVPTPGVEQQCLQHFNLGLRLARRARELALSALTAPAAPPPASSPRREKKRKRRTHSSNET